MDPSGLAPRRPPHITVNSGSGGDILASSLNSDSSAGTAGLTRQLIPSPRPSTGASGSRLPGPQLYAASEPQQSSEALLAPVRAKAAVPYSDYAGLESPTPTSMGSRRSSWSSDVGSRDSRMGPFASPFDDSRAPSRAGESDDENINTQTVAEKYNIMPSAGLLLFPEDVEKDDYLHNPDPNDSDREKCEVWNKRGLTNIGGLLLVTCAILTLFIAFPVLTFVRRAVTPKVACSGDDCLSDSMPLLVNQRVGLIDPDTPTSAYTKKSNDGTTLNLVFSDEFNKDGRTFYGGDDPYFEAVDIWYGATGDWEWYDPDAVTTANGTLNIKFDAFQNHNLNYRSGMLQSWNKLCFKGGRLEASLSLPGRGDTPGFWPGFWSMGNLGRPGFTATTDGMWPYSYWDGCDAGITKNQSAGDGISSLPGMRLPACTCSGQDHPSPGKSRSAPEIDVIEGSIAFLGTDANNGTGSASQSYQVAPFDIYYAPDYEYVAVYDDELSAVNSYKGGIYQQTMSTVSWLNNDWYDGNAYQVMGFEYTPGLGDISWFVGDDYTWKLDSRAIRPNGNIGQRMIPQEPMSIIMNLGMGPSFAEIFMPNIAEILPATMRFDYIRIYQDEESVTCDPEGYPTTDYIREHPAPYANVNLTSWQEGAGYSWPKNTLVDSCSA